MSSLMEMLASSEDMWKKGVLLMVINYLARPFILSSHNFQSFISASLNGKGISGLFTHYSLNKTNYF